MPILELRVQIRQGDTRLPVVIYNQDYDPEEDYAEIATIIRDMANYVTEILKEKAAGGS